MKKTKEIMEKNKMREGINVVNVNDEGFKAMNSSLNNVSDKRKKAKSAEYLAPLTIKPLTKSLASASFVLILFMLSLSILSIPSVKAQITGPAYDPNMPFSYMGEGFEAAFNPEMCETGQDFLVEIPIGGCSPMVVRSDLLEETEVMVFCKLTGFKINPFIEVPYIRKIRIERLEQNTYISGITFHQSKIALNPFPTLIGSPTLNDLGYLIVRLKSMPESEMPNSVSVNLTARIDYDRAKSLGISQNELLVPLLTDSEWQADYKKYSFWDGKGYVRATDIKEDKARIAVYANPLQYPISSSLIGKEEESLVSYLPGYYCSGGYKISLKSIDYPSITAEMDVNGNKLIVKEGMQILDSGCKLIDIEPSSSDIGGKIRISCAEETITLEKKAKKEIELAINGKTGVYSVGDNITPDVVIYDVTTRLDEEGKAINKLVLIEAEGNINLASRIKRVHQKFQEYVLYALNYGVSSNEFDNKVDEELDKLLLQENFKKKYVIIDEGTVMDIEGGKEIITTVKINKVQGLLNGILHETTKSFYDKAIKAYEEVAESYPYIKDNESKEYMGARALWEAVNKADSMNQSYDEALLLKKLVKKYPDSSYSLTAKEKLENLYIQTDTSKATQSIITGGVAYKFSLIDINEPSLEEKSVELSVDGKEQQFMEEDLITTGWVLESITNEQEIKVRSLNTTRREIITKNQEKNLDGVKVKLIKINLRKLAHVNILPYSREGSSTTNLSFKIGIEKRGINLSPEKTEEYIGWLNKKITEWSVFNDGLGKTVADWKKVCLYGAGALWVNSFFSNLEGKALARKEVLRGMSGQPGMIAECERLIATGKEQTVSQCLYNKQPEIDNQINVLVETQKEIDKSIEEDIKEKAKTDSAFNDKYKVWIEGKESPISGIKGKGRFDTEGLMKAMNATVFSKIDIGTFEYTDEVGKKRTMNSTKLKAVLSLTGSFPSEADAKDLLKNLKLMEKCEDDKSVKNSLLCNNSKDILGKSITRYEELLTTNKEEMGVRNNLGLVIQSLEKPTGEKIVIREQTWSDLHLTNPGGSISDTIKTAYFNYNKTDYVAIVEYDRGEVYNILSLYKLVGYDAAAGGNEVTLSSPKYKRFEAKFVAGSAWPQGLSKSINGIALKECSNNPYSPREIRFWESGEYEGLPALMPIDTQSGYYFATRAAGTGMQAYQESGKLSNFYICNVGPNGMPDFDFSTGPTGDDAACCAMIPYGETYQPGQLSWLEKAADKDVVNDALKCVSEAAVAYRAGKRDISTSCCPDCNIGKPAVSVPSVICEDFMDPSACRLMYNLCDPVICPSSRCDLGGRYPVEDVVQTGIIGSLSLCAHNFPEVAMPVCLTGVNAGIDSLLVTLNNTKSCLEESLATGKQVGICDAITSVYWCELFWKELKPFMKYGLPNLAGSIAGKKGGGEYLNFQKAFQQSADSLAFFSGFYAKNSFEAFKARSTANAGTEVCKGFVSVVYPTSVEMVDEWAKAESPYQVSAWFQETAMTTATIPAMSSYHVYYNIYAGKDQGRQYYVYLKQKPKAGYYVTYEMYQVPGASGYLAAGESVVIKRDFIAPADYTELCVRIDAKDHCGFGQATTNFAVTELQASYVADQAAQRIKSEEECISGTTGLINPSLNLQATIEEMLEPAIWKKGIVRICSSKNPGEGTNSGRWSRIGFCDESSTIGCWLDGDSVKEAIYDTGLQNKALSEAKNISNELLESDGFMGTAACKSSLADIEKGITLLKTHLDELGEEIKDSKIPDSEIKDRVNGIISDSGVVKSLILITENSIDEGCRAEAQTEIGAVYNYAVQKLSPLIPKEIRKEIGLTASTVIQFEFKSSDLTPEAKAVINGLKKKYNLTSGDMITIAGYSSNDLTEGEYDIQLNNGLSDERAKNIKKEIVRVYAFNTDDITTKAVGPTLNFVDPKKINDINKMINDQKVISYTVSEEYENWAANEPELKKNRIAVITLDFITRRAIKEEITPATTGAKAETAKELTVEERLKIIQEECKKYQQEEVCKIKNNCSWEKKTCVPDCKITDAYWSLDLKTFKKATEETKVKEGTPLYMIVKGNDACLGTVAGFNVYKDSFPIDEGLVTFFTPFASFEATAGNEFVAKGNWTTSWVKGGIFGGDPRYHFNAKSDRHALDSDSITVIKNLEIFAPEFDAFVAQIERLMKDREDRCYTPIEESVRGFEERSVRGFEESIGGAYYISMTKTSIGAINQEHCLNISYIIEETNKQAKSTLVCYPSSGYRADITRIGVGGPTSEVLNLVSSDPAFLVKPYSPGEIEKELEDINNAVLYMIRLGPTEELPYQEDQIYIGFASEEAASKNFKECSGVAPEFIEMTTGCAFTGAYWTDLKGNKINKTPTRTNVTMVVEGTAGCNSIPITFIRYRAADKAEMGDFTSAFKEGKAQNISEIRGQVGIDYYFEANSMPMVLISIKSSNITIVPSL